MAPGHAPMVLLSLLALSVVDVVIKGNGIVHCEVEIPEIPINPVIRVVALRTLARAQRQQDNFETRCGTGVELPYVVQHQRTWNSNVRMQRRTRCSAASICSPTRSAWAVMASSYVRLVQ
jgi:hypothetical protein